MIVEDGSGVTNANSYMDGPTAVQYANDRGITAWTSMSVSAQTSALVRATDYIEMTYRPLCLPLTATQGLQFPTVDPRSYQLVQRATMMIAVQMMTDDFSIRVDRAISRQEQKLDGVGLTVTDYDGPRTIDHYPAVSAMLRTVARLRRSDVSCGRVTRDPWFDPPRREALEDPFNYLGGFYTPQGGIVSTPDNPEDVTP